MLRPALLLVSFFASFPAFAATLEVGPDREFKTLGAAVQASKAGDTILIDPGVYKDDFAIIHHPLTIEAIGGYAVLNAGQSIPNGKGILIANADLTVRSLIFYGSKVPDRNGAGIRYQKGKLVVEDCIFQENENGILGNSSSSGQIIIGDSVFQENGYGDGYSHGIYIGKIASLTVENSHFISTRTGHHIKSRAARTTITGSRIEDGEASSSYAIDLPNGGINKIVDNTIIQGSQPENRIIISIGTKVSWTANETMIAANQFANLATKGVAVRNALTEPVAINGNTFYGPIKMAQGNITATGNRFYEEVPPYLSSPLKGRREPDYEAIEEPASP